MPEGIADGQDLVVQGLSKSFGALDVLQGLDVSIPDGQFVTLLGPSGCGKTTFLRILAGFEVADSGSVHLGGQNLLSLPPHRRAVNTVFQNYALFPHLDVFENVAFGLRSRKLPESEIRKRVGDVLGLARIGDLGDRLPQELSGGQKQRVALARALVVEPEVLLLDEPMSALDANLRHDLQMELRRLQRDAGITFILVTHDQDEAIAVSDRILVMNQGRIEQDDSAEQVYERPVSRFVAGFMGRANLLAGRAAGDRNVLTSIGRLLVGEVPAWKEGTLAIRPEDIEVRDEAPAVNGVRARIGERLFRGDHWELSVHVGEEELRVIVEPDQYHEEGQEIWLEMPVDDLLVLRD
jgi:spermidine/putrescine transport system ATP-binding protein